MQLSGPELAAIRAVFAQVPAVRRVRLFGSRAKGTARPGSDVDLAVEGIPDLLTRARLMEALDDLPFAFRCDLVDLDRPLHAPLREHIERVGLVIYP
jgi:uncharacterized protein